jgi:Flp pilus assembly protein TadG
MRRLRNQRGVSLAEAASALAVAVPALVMLAFVIIEAAQAYLIARDLQIGASLAARALGKQGSNTSASQQSQILSNVTVGNHVVDPSQFYNVQWNNTANPPTVTVYVQYKSTGKQPPTLPDPLKLGSAFVIKSQATYRVIGN